MEIIILRVGATQMDFVADGEALYVRRLNHYVSRVNMFDLQASTRSSKHDPAYVKRTEGMRILESVHSSDLLVLLDEQGKSYDSRGFAAVLQKWMNRGPKRLVFAVGGAFGFSDEVYARADAKLSLSPMTFSHQLIRVLFLEQLYRGFSILRGEPYHND